jgi:hypothetical protein
MPKDGDKSPIASIVKPEFEELWAVDEEQIKNFKSFSEDYKAAKKQLKPQEGMYELFFEHGESKVVKSGAAQEIINKEKPEYVRHLGGSKYILPVENKK